MITLNIPKFNENNEHIGYITVNVKYIKYWSIIKNDNTLSVEIELTDNVTFNTFYNYNDKSELNLSNLKLFKDLIFSLNKLGSKMQIYSNHNVLRSIHGRKSSNSIESKEKPKNTNNRDDILNEYKEPQITINKTLVGKYSNIQRDSFYCLTTVGSTVISGSGSNNGLYYSEDNGHTWQRSDIQSGNFYCLTVIGSTVIAGSSSDDGLYYLD